MRWGIETVFRSLKYAVGPIYLHTKKLKLIFRKIFASFLVYNFLQAATWTVDSFQGRPNTGVCQFLRCCLCLLRRPLSLL